MFVPQGGANGGDVVFGTAQNVAGNPVSPVWFEFSDDPEGDFGIEGSGAVDECAVEVRRAGGEDQFDQIRNWRHGG